MRGRCASCGYPKHVLLTRHEPRWNDQIFLMQRCTLSLGSPRVYAQSVLIVSTARLIHDLFYSPGLLAFGLLLLTLTALAVGVFLCGGILKCQVATVYCGWLM